jgi:hypothetical protein
VRRKVSLGPARKPLRAVKRILIWVSLGLVVTGGGFARDQRVAKISSEDAAGFAEFSVNVQKYVALHKRLERSLPKLKTKASPDMIASHQRALAKRIQLARGNARGGDIFVPKAARAFRHAIDREFRGPQGKNARATIEQGSPLKEVTAEVNQVYPSGLPYTTVPPTLLLKFPKLPEELAYRIAGHDLLLLDVKANLVVDVLKKVLP